MKNEQFSTPLSAWKLLFQYGLCFLLDILLSKQQKYIKCFFFQIAVVNYQIMQPYQQFKWEARTIQKLI